MTARRSVEVDGLGHGDMPIPMGSRIGPLVCSSGISGTDARTGRLPADGAEQVRGVFANLEAFLTAAGAVPDDVARVGVLLQEPALRDTVNACWVAMFPDAASRPARHTTVRDLPGEMLVQVEVIAFCRGDVSAG